MLSGLFFILTLMAYTGGRHVLSLALFCCGPMAKPMLVTVPVVLLLLDHWLLRRGWRLVEKLPFFAASIAVSIVTFTVHREAGATAALSLIPPAVRLENALILPAILAALALAGVTALAILAMLLPVIGIVQAGAQARADRYT